VAKKIFYKKGEEQAYPYSFLIKLLMIIAVAVALYFIIGRIGNAFLPK